MALSALPRTRERSFISLIQEGSTVLLRTPQCVQKLW